MIPIGCVGGRQEATLQTDGIELLPHGEHTFFERHWIEKLLNPGSCAFVANFLVVRSVGQQQLFVVTQKRRRICTALIPQQHEPSHRLEYPYEFPLGPPPVEPMPSLGGSDKIHAPVWQRGRLG